MVTANVWKYCFAGTIRKKNIRKLAGKTTLTLRTTTSLEGYWIFIVQKGKLFYGSGGMFTAMLAKIVLMFLFAGILSDSSEMRKFAEIGNRTIWLLMAASFFLKKKSGTKIARKERKPPQKSLYGLENISLTLKTGMSATEPRESWLRLRRNNGSKNRLLHVVCGSGKICGSE